MRTVLGKGPKEPVLIIIGEAPGRKEVEQGEPFVGPSGKFLSHMLRINGVSQAECYITNVIKHQIGKSKLAGLQDGEYAACINALIRELSDIKCNTILTLGGIALTALCDNVEGIDKWRGSVLSPTLDIPQRKVIPSFHPARVLHSSDYRFKSIIEFDIRRALEESDTTSIARPTRHLHIQPTLMEALDFCNWLLSPEVPFVTCDIEMLGGLSYGHNISAVGFAGANDIAMSIPLKDYNGNYWTTEEEMQIWRVIDNVIRKKPISNQNVYFDLFHLRKLGVCHTLVHMDTLAAHALLWPELPHDLGFLTSMYTKEPYYKDEGTTWKTTGDFKQYWRYNALDCITAHQVAIALAEELTERHLYNYYFKYVRPMGEVLYKMALRGVLVDDKARRRESSRMLTRASRLEDTFSDAVGYYVNTNPSNILKHFLYNDLNLPENRSAKGGLSTSENTLLKFFRQTDSAVFHYILNVRKIKKMRSSFYEYKLHPDGRLRSAFHQNTDSGRLGSRKCYDNYGTNLQNFPREARQQVIAGEGRTFVGADLSQVEARIVACESRDPRLLHIFDSGQDIHLTTASFIFGLLYSVLLEQYKAGDPTAIRYRQLGKASHKLNYGLSPQGFFTDLYSNGINLPMSEVRAIYDSYHSTFQNIKGRWHPEIKEELRRTRRLDNVFGRHRYFLGRLDDDLFREGYSWKPQSTAVEIVNRAILAIQPKLPKDAFVVLQLHDEAVLETRLEDADRVASMLKSALEVKLPVYDIVVPADVHIADNWGDLK